MFLTFRFEGYEFFLFHIDDDYDLKMLSLDSIWILEMCFSQSGINQRFCYFCKVSALHTCNKNHKIKHANKNLSNLVLAFNSPCSLTCATLRTQVLSVSELAPNNEPKVEQSDTHGIQILSTGGNPLTRFSLHQSLAYVPTSGGFLRK